MNSKQSLKDTIFNIDNHASFERAVFETFRHQAEHNAVYRQFIHALEIDPGSVNQISQIPFLPIRFFKTHEVQTGNFTPELVFTSSGTTGQKPSRHAVPRASHYERSFQAGF